MTSGSARSRPQPAATAAAKHALRDVLGAARVQDGDDILAQHGRGESFHPEARPDAVVWPHSTEEAAAIVAICAEHQLPIIPFGAGTSLEGHVAALAGGISIDMREMTRIDPPSLENLDVTVEAGVTRRALDARLRASGVFFPVDPGADATIGGMVATGASGTTTVRYGAMRENVVSLTAVDASGRVFRTHSRARKSSAGYDLTRLLIGSEGTLALICEATLRLQPTPEAAAAAQCTFPTVAAAVESVVRLTQYGVPIVRVELADELAIQAIDAHFGLTLRVAPTLLLEFQGGSDAEVAAQAAEAAEITAEFGADDFVWATDEPQRRKLWEGRHGALEATRGLRPGSAILTTDVCVPISMLAGCVVETQRDIADAQLVASIVGHVGDGNFHVMIALDPDCVEDVERAERFHARLVTRALAVDGTCTGEHGVGYGKARFLVPEHGGPAVALMRSIKMALDPDGIFNPGKSITSPEVLAE